MADQPEWRRRLVGGSGHRPLHYGVACSSKRRWGLWPRRGLCNLVRQIRNSSRDFLQLAQETHLSLAAGSSVTVHVLLRGCEDLCIVVWFSCAGRWPHVLHLLTEMSAKHRRSGLDLPKSFLPVPDSRCFNVVAWPQAFQFSHRGIWRSACLGLQAGR